MKPSKLPWGEAACAPTRRDDRNENCRIGFLDREQAPRANNSRVVKGPIHAGHQVPGDRRRGGNPSSHLSG